MQSSTGQYSTQAGDPAQPVQHSVMTASSFGFFLRGVSMPFERGSCFSSSGTSPGAFATSGVVAIEVDYIAGRGFCKVPSGVVLRHGCSRVLPVMSARRSHDASGNVGVIGRTP